MIAIILSDKSQKRIESGRMIFHLSPIAMRLSRYAGACPGDRTLRAGAGRRAGRVPPPPRFEQFVYLAFLEVNLPRKEVIQPHVPVRLPCYDFTPLTLPTFDASLPCGLGRRLRVQTTRVV